MAPFRQEDINGEMQKKPSKYKVSIFNKKILTMDEIKIK